MFPISLYSSVLCTTDLQENGLCGFTDVLPVWGLGYYMLQVRELEQLSLYGRVA